MVVVSFAVHEVLGYVFFNRAQLSTTVDSAMATRDNPAVPLRHVPMPRPGFSRAFFFLGARNCGGCLWHAVSSAQPSAQDWGGAAYEAPKSLSGFSADFLTFPHAFSQCLSSVHRFSRRRSLSCFVRLRHKMSLIADAIKGVTKRWEKLTPLLLSLAAKPVAAVAATRLIGDQLTVVMPGSRSSLAWIYSPCAYERTSPPDLRIAGSQTRGR